MAAKFVCSGVTPFRLLPLVAATFPKGTASVVAAKFPAVPKGAPLGELAPQATEGVPLTTKID